jgi:hypothetical protein
MLLFALFDDCLLTAFICCSFARFVSLRTDKAGEMLVQASVALLVSVAAVFFLAPNTLPFAPAPAPVPAPAPTSTSSASPPISVPDTSAKPAATAAAATSASAASTPPPAPAKAAAPASAAPSAKAGGKQAKEAVGHIDTASTAYPYVLRAVQRMQWSANKPFADFARAQHFPIVFTHSAVTACASSSPSPFLICCLLL